MPHSMPQKGEEQVAWQFKVSHHLSPMTSIGQKSA